MEEATPLLHTATIESPVLILLKDDLPAPSVTLVDAFAVNLFVTPLPTTEIVYPLPELVFSSRFL